MDENKSNLPATTKKGTLTNNEDNGKFFKFPNSPASNTMMNVVSHVGNLGTFANRLEQNSHSTQLDLFAPQDGSKSERIKYSTDNTETTIQLDNIDLFTKANKPLKKILTYTLVKLSKENVTESLDRDISIRFPLEDFVDLGCYKTLRTARQAFNQAKNPLTSIKIEGVVRDKKDMRQITESGIEVLFTGAHIKNGIVEIYLNKRINWDLFALQYFSILPKSYFSLSDNAADTLLNIFMLARKRLNDIGRNKYFTISFRTLQQILELPDESATKNPGRDIKEPILNALNEVSKIEDGDIIIEPIFNSNGNIIEFLEQGYAKIHLHNEYLEYFDDLAKTKKNKIENTMKKREELADRAKVKAMTNKLEKQKKSRKTSSDEE